MSWPFTFEGLFIVIHQIYDSDLSNEGLPTLTCEEMTCFKVQLEKQCYYVAVIARCRVKYGKYFPSFSYFATLRE